MSLLAIDIETFSDVDLPKCGVYAYSDSPLFEILLFAFAFDDEPTQVVDLACGEQLPDRVLAALEDETVTKTAFNAAFERTCISRHLGRRLSPVGWQCTAVQSAIADWNAGKIPVALIHPASAGHGLNLQDGGSSIVWFGLTWSLELYQQLNARLWRQGQKHTVVVQHLVTAGTHDEDIVRALEQKDMSQTALIAAVKARIGGVT